MGFDITYHPISETEVRTLWFDLLDNPAALEKLQAEVAEDEGADEYIANLVEGAQEEESDDLNLAHLFPLAIVAGIVRPYWYIRGGAFSFCVEETPELKRYLGSWRELVPQKYRGLTIEDTLTSNDTAGCFIASQQVPALSDAIQKNQLPAAALDRAFSHGRMAVFLSALEDAASQNLGLLEASEVVIPNPLGGEWPQCLTNADHCHREGVDLYTEAAAAQVKAASEQSPKKRPK